MLVSRACLVRILCSYFIFVVRQSNGYVGGALLNNNIDTVFNLRGNFDSDFNKDIIVSRSVNRSGVSDSTLNNYPDYHPTVLPLITHFSINMTLSMGGLNSTHDAGYFIALNVGILSLVVCTGCAVICNRLAYKVKCCRWCALPPPPEPEVPPVPVNCEVIPNETIHHVEVQIVDHDAYCHVNGNQTETTAGGHSEQLISLSAVAVPAPPPVHFDFIPTRTMDRGVNILLPEAIATGEEGRTIITAATAASCTANIEVRHPLQVVTAIPILMYGDISTASS